MNEKHSLLAGLTCLADAKTRSISPENFHGEKGKGGMAVEGTGKECARELGQPQICPASFTACFS